jgi:WD40 repeat protein
VLLALVGIVALVLLWPRNAAPPPSRAALLVESDVPGAEVVVRQGDRVHASVRLNAARRLELAPGEYTLALANASEEARLSPERVVLRADGRAAVRVWRVAASPVALVSRPAPLEGVGSWTVETIRHRGTTHGVAYRPDGRLLATACADGAVRVWEADAGRLAHAFLGHAAAVTAVAWSPDGARLASCSEDGTVRLWNATTGKVLHTLRHPEAARCLAWSPDGTTLASGGTDQTIRLWDTATGRPRSPLQEQAQVNGLAWSPDGEFVASAGGDGKVRLWRPDDGVIARELAGHHKGVRAVDWSPDGKVLASVSEDREVRQWNLATGGLVRAPEVLWNAGRAVAWSPDGSLLAFLASGAGVSDARTGRRLRSLNNQGLPFTALAWSADSRVLALGRADGTVSRYDVHEGRDLAALPGNGGPAVDSVNWSPDGRLLATGGHDARVRLWEPATGRLVHVLEGHTMYVTTVAFSPDSRLLASGVRDGTLRLWDASTGAFLRSMDGVSGNPRWSPDGRTIACTQQEAGPVQLWDAETGRLRPTLAGHTGRTNFVTWSPDGTRLATVGSDRWLCFWDAATGEMRRAATLPGEGQRLAWSPDGKWLAVRQGNGAIRLWDGASDDLLKLRLTAGNVRQLVWSRDSKVLLALESQQLHAWEVPSGGELRFLQGPVVGGAVTLSPDGALVAASVSTTLWLWDAETGRRRGALVALGGGEYVSVEPTGHYRGSPGAEAQLVHVVQTEDGQLTLTPQEFAQRFGWQNEPERVRLLPAGVAPPAGPQ